MTASLRFCPKCLGEGESYYSLTWRFKALAGCSKHKCYLLEKCTYCHHCIALVTTPFSFGICPNCTQPLHSCTTLPVKEAEQAELDYTQQELEFLLLPHPCEAQACENLAKIGNKLRQVRKDQHLSISQWAARLGQEPKEILFIEDGRLENGVASLATYLAYTKYTNLSFSQLFC